MSQQHATSQTPTYTPTYILALLSGYLRTCLPTYLSKYIPTFYLPVKPIYLPPYPPPNLILTYLLTYLPTYLPNLPPSPLPFPPNYLQPICYRLGVDNEVILNFPTPSNGYWGYGGFTGTNPWTNGGHDAPFDKEVRLDFVNVSGARGFPPRSQASSPPS